MVDYKTYIRSPQWKERSFVTKQARKNRCHRCGISGKIAHLHTHHLTYEHLGNEYKEELEVLCDYCHALEYLGVAADEPFVPKKKAEIAAERRLKQRAERRRRRREKRKAGRRRKGGQ